MTDKDYLTQAIQTKDASATLYWLFDRLFRSVKTMLSVLNRETRSHYETETIGLELLQKGGYITSEDIHLYRTVRQMYLLSEYAGQHYKWSEIQSYIIPVKSVCDQLKLTIFSEKQKTTS